MRKILFAIFAAMLAMTVATAAEAAVEDGPLGPVGAVGDYMNDAATTAEIKARLAAEHGVDASAISVTTDHSVVTLEGVVDSQAESELAERVAGGMSNVKAVKNRLGVRH
ncbi:MAG: BON domain-containing protein [Deltaproteobacteria bacterium]|nr:BON domain-containing protein [Deltaproteobacteria bacterium]